MVSGGICIFIITSNSFIALLKVNFIFYSLFYFFVFTECRGEDSVDQPDKYITEFERRSVTLQCKYKTTLSSQPELFWYIQEENSIFFLEKIFPKSFLNTCWGETNMEEQIMMLSSRRDFTLKCHQIQFHWQSRIYMCLTLLCTTVLWDPQWLKHTQHSYKNYMMMFNYMMKGKSTCCLPLSQNNNMQIIYSIYIYIYTYIHNPNSRNVGTFFKFE